MILTWEDRLKVLLMPGWIYYQRKLASEARKGEPEITILPELLLSRGKVAVDVDALGHLQAGLPVSSRNVLFFPHE